MFSRSDLLVDEIPGIQDALFEQMRLQPQHHDIVQNLAQCFIQKFQDYMLSSTLNRLPGLDRLPIRDVTIGCNHFIDSLIIKHGLPNLQILEHDYKYYRRLDPNLEFARVGGLRHSVPLLVAAPFPGCLDLHWNWNALLEECDQKHIPVHVDGAWLGLARDIEIDLGRGCIQSLGLSLSKGLGLSWNRIGVRWSKNSDDTDSITIMNRFNMIPETLLRVGITALETVPIDYLWNKYHDRYFEICQALRLRPTKIVNAAMSIDRKHLYGLAKLL